MLSTFDYTLRYVPAKDNLLADGLSRLPLPSTTLSEDNVLRVEELWLESLWVISKQINLQSHLQTSCDVVGPGLCR